MNIKNLIVLGAVLFVGAFAANAQYSMLKSITIMAGGTNYVAAATTNNYSSASIVADVQKQSYTGITVAGKASGANTGTFVAYFAKSIDGVNYETTPSLTVTATMNGTAVVRKLAPTQVDGVASLKLIYLENTNATYITNITISYNVKR